MTAERSRGRSRRRRPGNPIGKIIAALLIVCAVLFVLFWIRHRAKEPAPETTSTPAATVASETTAAPETTEAPEPSTEAEPEPDWHYYLDKSGTERRYLIQDGAALREIEWGMPYTDENGNPIFENTDDSYPDHEMLRGVDVSKDQGLIDWHQVRDARCDFVIICADERFEENYRGAYKLGLKIGAYYPSVASSEEEARAEAENFLTYLEGKELDLFAAYMPEDMADDTHFQGMVISPSDADLATSHNTSDGQHSQETDSPSSDDIGEVNVGAETGDITVGSAPGAGTDGTDTTGDIVVSPADPARGRSTRIAEAFCETIANAGFTPAIYASMLSEAERYDMTALADKYTFWYSGLEGTPSTPYRFNCWQYCLTGGIRGITGPANLNLLLTRPYQETPEEEGIYSYTQFYDEAYQNSSWVNKRVSAAGWNGEWGRIQAGGQEFMMFGCGVCCLSNIVSTMTGRVVDPEEMYYALKDQTNYYPESGRGAVSWEYLQTMCAYYGLSMELRRKPADYESFVNEIQSVRTAVILADGGNSRRLWWYTDGHYVNIWAYDPETGTVFVTDPSTHYNRQRVKLIDIYNILKTASNYQYAVVRDPQ